MGLDLLAAVAVAMAHLVDLVRPIPIQVACFRLMTELVTLRIPMMLIVSVVVVVLLGLEPGIVCLAAFAAVRIVVVIRSTSVASAQSALLAFHPIRQPRTRGNQGDGGGDRKAKCKPIN